MNVSDVASRVKRTFGDDAGVQIQDDDIIRWVNDAQSQISISNEGLLETTVTADVIANQAEYDSPTDISILRSLSFKGFRLKNLSFQEFNEYLDGFETQQYGTGTPEVFMVWSGKITLFPTPESNVLAGLRIYYVKQPAIVANLADALTVPLQYHLSVVDYCLQQAYELDEDLEKSAYKKGQFDATMQTLNDRNKWTAQEFYPRITTLPEDENYSSDWGFI